MKIFLNKENRIRNSWWVVIFFLMLSSVLFPLIILSDRFSFEITMAHQAILILAVSIVCQKLRHEPISGLVGKINLRWFKELFAGIMAGAALMILPVLILTVLGYIHWQVNEFSYSVIMDGFMMLLIAAVAEELLFRGFMFQRLLQAFGEWPAQFVVSALFLLTHIDNPGMTGIVKALASVNIFIASVMFGLAYIKTKSLAMPLGLHFMANFMQGTMLGFGVSGGKDPSLLTPVFDHAPLWLSGGDFGIEASVLGLCFVILLTVLLYRWRAPEDEKRNGIVEIS